MKTPMESLPNNFTAVDPDYFKVKLVNWSIQSSCYLLVALLPLILRLFGLPAPWWLVIVPRYSSSELPCWFCASCAVRFAPSVTKNEPRI